ncbi:hypothetical protein ACH5RR_008276 [Cinchona calisaya]|uniref:Uncharacterized protein n=1 Tax=Cinchona calisaya TaxID=153742 RepID=A0ABD3ABB4_9GENT
MIHKPPFFATIHVGFSLPPPIYGGHNRIWSRQPLDQQPGIGRLVAENYHMGSPSSSSRGGGIARFDVSGNPRFSTPMVEGLEDHNNGTILVLLLLVQKLVKKS